MSNGEFVNSIIPKESNLDFVVCKLSIKVEELQHFLRGKEDFARDNKGFISVDILRSKNDPSKIYSKFSEWKPKVQEVSSSQHQPDRGLDDIPFQYKGAIMPLFFISKQKTNEQK